MRNIIPILWLCIYAVILKFRKISIFVDFSYTRAPQEFLANMTFLCFNNPILGQWPSGRPLYPWNKYMLLYTGSYGRITVSACHYVILSCCPLTWNNFLCFNSHVFGLSSPSRSQICLMLERSTCYCLNETFGES
jgi:hypothetical protein